MCKSDSSQSLKTLSLVGKPTAITNHSEFWDNSCFKSYQSKRLLWRWAFRHSDAQPGHHATRWRSRFSPRPLFQNLFASSMAQCFFGHFGVSSFNGFSMSAMRAPSVHLHFLWHVHGINLKKLESFANLRPTSPEALCSKGTWIQTQHCWTQ